MEKLVSLTADQIRVLISWLPVVASSQEDIRKAFRENPSRLDELLADGVKWADLYERPVEDHLARLASLLGLGPLVIEASKADDPRQVLLDSMQDDHQVTAEESSFAEIFVLLWAYMNSLECLMVFGRYLHDLIASAMKGGADGDKALCNAIRIDPSIVTGSIATRRLNRALVLEDDAFLQELRKALEGRTGNQAAYLRQFRFVIQALAEAGALDLPNKQLVQLMFDAGVYRNVGNAQKNVAELVRKAKKEHAI